MSKAWMPLFIGDYERKTADLSAHEFGIYTRLIMWAWDHQGTIPRDVVKLANITRCERRLWWRFGAPIVARFFDIVDASTMQQERVVTELHKAQELSNKRKAAALQKHSNSSANAEQMPTQSQSQSKREEEEVAANAAPSVAEDGKVLEFASRQTLSSSVAAPYAIDLGGHVHVTSKHLEEWERDFDCISVRAELRSAASWLHTFGKKWFVPAEKYLAKKNREARVARDKAIATAGMQPKRIDAWIDEA